MNMIITLCTHCQKCKRKHTHTHMLSAQVDFASFLIGGYMKDSPSDWPMTKGRWEKLWAITVAVSGLGSPLTAEVKKEKLRTCSVFSGTDPAFNYPLGNLLASHGDSDPKTLDTQSLEFRFCISKSLLLNVVLMLYGPDPERQTPNSW